MCAGVRLKHIHYTFGYVGVNSRAARSYQYLTHLSFYASIHGNMCRDTFLFYFVTTVVTF